MPNQVFKVALPGYRADIDTDPDHFSVYYDSSEAEENVLIKEFNRSSVSVAPGTSATISHNLGYVPLAFCFVQLDPNTWALVGGDSTAVDAHIELNDTELIIWNDSFSNTYTFKYYIFYDQQV